MLRTQSFLENFGNKSDDELEQCQHVAISEANKPPSVSEKIDNASQWSSSALKDTHTRNLHVVENGGVSAARFIGRATKEVYDRYEEWI